VDPRCCHRGPDARGLDLIGALDQKADDNAVELFFGDVAIHHECS
jgi:hypothetical protein